MAVSVSSGPAFSVGSATRLFAHPSLRPGCCLAPYDVSVDGQRFILAESAAESAVPSASSLATGWAQVAVSPDGGWILYVQDDQRGADLMLLENFR